MTDHTYTVRGPSGAIDVTVDEWGVPHIVAGSSSDVFFGQGFVTARNRLFQIDWWRRRGLGLTADVLGEDYVERDRASRLFLYRADMRAEWLAYGNNTKSAVSSFTAGINAWINLTRESPDLLSPEFGQLGYLPDSWEPADVVRIRSHGLFANLEEEVARAATIRDFGFAAEDLRRTREPHRPLDVPPGLDLTLFDEDVLTVYRLAMGPVTAPGARRAPDGSNNWVVAGQRTATGRPLLANDPHRAMAVPSLRHLIHLKCPEFDVIGAGEPALPGVSIGHNGSVAFGLTVWNVDQEDLYVYELHPENPGLYRYQDSWVPMTTVRERVPVKGSEQAEVELQFTQHGPVIKVDAERSVAFAVRAAWLEPGMAPYLASIEYLGARDAAEVRAHLNRWGAPGLNHIQADTDGNIAWSPRALVPIRPNWDGLLPVPGDGRYEWEGFRTADELPEIVNPNQGWIATANQYNLPEDGTWEPVHVSSEWFAASRYQRITEVLASDTAVSVESAAQLQNDYVSLPAQAVCELLTNLEFDDSGAEAARQILLSWDHCMHHDSGAAVLFERWLRGPLRLRLYTDALFGLVGPNKLDQALAAVLPQEEHFGDLSADQRLLADLAMEPTVLHKVLEETLSEAVAGLREELGDDPHLWAWGKVNISLLRHPAADLLPADLPWLTIGPQPKSGGSETVGLAAPSPATGIEDTGASFRIVIDVGNWDRSIAINTPGQVGDPRSQHYADLYQRWLDDEYFPLLYTQEAIADHAHDQLRLFPVTAS